MGIVNVCIRNHNTGRGPGPAFLGGKYIDGMVISIPVAAHLNRIKLIAGAGYRGRSGIAWTRDLLKQTVVHRHNEHSISPACLDHHHDVIIPALYRAYIMYFTKCNGIDIDIPILLVGHPQIGSKLAGNCFHGSALAIVENQSVWRKTVLPDYYRHVIVSIGLLGN